MTASSRASGHDEPRPSSAIDEARPHVRFPPHLMYDVGRLYYIEDATQAEIAARLGMSRATVSRVLAEARRAGVVHIEIVPPSAQDDAALARQLAEALDLEDVRLGAAYSPSPGAALAPALSEVLRGVGLQADDVLLVASGRTVYEAARAGLPALPGVLVVPTVGGHDEPEVWYQANEIARQVAAEVRGSPVFLFAPALPAEDLYVQLVRDDSIRRVFELWSRARCAVLGVGGPTLQRLSLPRFVPTDALDLRDSVGDVCYRFFANTGEPLDWPGSHRLVATSVEMLRAVPVSIAVAVGADKVPSLIAGARGGYFNHLVTDAATASAVLAAV